MQSSSDKPGQQQTQVTRVTANGRERLDDVLAVEEPLEIRVVFGPKDNRRSKSLSITMRTPGSDFELAAGFLLSENIVSRPSDILKFEHVGPAAGDKDHGNTLMVELGFDVLFEVERLQRHFYTTSSCGICGKASLEAVRAQDILPVQRQWRCDAKTIFRLPSELRSQQSVFDRTGGLHAAGLFDARGGLIAIREDVGRHNAVDKLIGSQMLGDVFPLDQRVMVVSGRASFELVQKALMARIPVMVAVGAPSSLAVDLAREFAMTLIGFTSSQRFNVYTGQQWLA